MLYLVCLFLRQIISRTPVNKISGITDHVSSKIIQTHRGENGYRLKSKREQCKIMNRSRNGNKGATAVVEVPGSSAWKVILFSASNDFKNTTR